MVRYVFASMNRVSRFPLRHPARPLRGLLAPPHRLAQSIEGRPSGLRLVLGLTCPNVLPEAYDGCEYAEPPLAEARRAWTPWAEYGCAYIVYADCRWPVGGY